MYKFCAKCGNITLGNKYLEEKCWVCGNIIILVPTKYIQENEILTDKEIEERAIKLREELVKTSPEFDQNFFDHRDEILAKQSAELEAKMAHGKAILGSRDKENKFRVECPYCHATNVKKITNTSKAVHTAIFGIFSVSRNSKQWHCNNCNSDF